MSEGTIFLVANILVIFAWLGAGLFVGFYAAKSPWRKTLYGRTQMYRAVTMLSLLTYALTARWIHALPIVEIALGLIIYAAVGVMEWRLFFNLRRAQKEGRHNATDQRI